MHGCVHFFFFKLWSNYVIQGVKNSIKKLFGFTPLCESQWQEVGFTLVWDNCTLPRSVVPILVSLWPSEPARAIFRLHVLLILSCLIPILSDTPPHHSRRQIKAQWAVERTDLGVSWNCARSEILQELFLLLVLLKASTAFVFNLFCGHEVAWFVT